jgi:hypothetical protein
VSEFDDFVARKRAAIAESLAERKRQDKAAEEETARIAALVREFERITLDTGAAIGRLNRKLDGIGKLTQEEAKERNTPDGAIAHVAARYHNDDAKPNEFAVLRFDLRKDSTVAAFIVAGGPKKAALDITKLADADAAWIERTLEKFVQAVA